MRSGGCAQRLSASEDREDRSVVESGLRFGGFLDHPCSCDELGTFDQELDADLSLLHTRTADEQLAPAQVTLRELTGVLGLRLAEKTGSGDADKFIDLLVEVRSAARAQKLWALSDMIRDRLKELGVTIEDSKDGTSWRYS